MNKKTKVISAVNTALVLASLFYAGVSATESPPPLDSECKTPWNLVWNFPTHRYCSELGENNLGDYYLYSCEGEKYSEYFGWYKTIVKFASQCIYSEIIIPENNTQVVFLPLIIKWDTIIGTPIAP